MVRDDTAEKLEVLGLWRRAATCWLEIQMNIHLSDEQRMWVRNHRYKCLKLAQRKESVLAG